MGAAAVLVTVLALVAAGPAAGSAPARGNGRRAHKPGLVTGGYPYARDCPQAGEREQVDRWKMFACNCTSYVAWALARNGYRVDWFVPGAMDAWNWPNVARRHGIPVGTRPRPGAVAVWPEWGRYGHVAFVAAVHTDGTFDVDEYNAPHRVEYGFDRRTHVSPRGVVFVYVPRRPAGAHH